MSKAPISSLPPQPLAVAHKPATLAVGRAVRPTVVAYHELTPELTDYSYALTCQNFEEHLQVSAELTSNSSGGQSPLVFSFDDGHISNYVMALPLLQKYSCKALFFVIGSRMGEHKDFMTWAHLRELVALGHRVEAHGWSHTFLTRCSDDDLRTELVRTREVLEDRLGAPVAALSAPHGRWNRRVLGACAAAGYRQLFDSNPWPARRKLDKMEVVGRLIAVQSLDSSRLLRWMTMGRAEAGLRRGQQAVKRSARHLLGDNLYYQLWARFSGWTGPDDAKLNGGQ
ncbi:MAG TPA: polysaccharide deacetylase family protein [Candidatus Angelobacter sp.]